MGKAEQIMFVISIPTQTMLIYVYGICQKKNLYINSRFQIL